MRIAEINSTPDHHRRRRETSVTATAGSDSTTTILHLIESTIKSLEHHSPPTDIPDTYSSSLQQSLSQLSQVSQLSPFPNSTKLQLWKLAYRIWNACVDISNSSVTKISDQHAKLRNIAADFLFFASDVVGIPSSRFKIALFYHKAGLLWQELKKLDLANSCLEKAADVVSDVEIGSISDDEERKLILDVHLARARVAWEVKDRNSAIALLSRSKNVLFSVARNYSSLANQYLEFGKMLLVKTEVLAAKDALKMLNDALELCEKGLKLVKKTEETLNLKELRLKTLRFIAAAHLQCEDFESVLKCVKVLREVGSGGDHHPSLNVLAMKAWLGLGCYIEAEKELRGIAASKGIPEGVWVSAIESYFQSAGAAGAETVKGVFLGLLERCHVSASAAVMVVNRVVGNRSECGEGMKVRVGLVAELVSDERVVALFGGDGTAKERNTMNALLWNCAAEHFRSKEYLLSAEMFEKSLLYVPHGVENRILRAKGYRVLCLCYLGLLQLERAEEYINEAETLEPNIASTFLKFKILLQKNNTNGAISQVQAMPSCLDFSTDFLSLSAHEAIASNSITVATASLSLLLDFYSSGEPMRTNEVVVFRTLVTILCQNPENDHDILKHMKRAYERCSEIGPERFFGKAEVGRREKDWFAGNAWNFGIRTGQIQNYDISAEFFNLASEFYGVAIDDEESQGNVVMVCKSVILSVSAIIADERRRNGTLLETEVRQAIELLGRAGKILMPNSASTRNDDILAAIEPHFFFIYTWCAYDLYSRLNNTSDQQLLLVKNFSASKSCDTNHLLQIGLEASQGPRANLVVSTFALNTSLSNLLAHPSPDYQTVALILRKLISIATIQKGDRDEDSIVEMYRQAHRIMVGLKEGEYPTEEAKWLAMTAWNRASLPVKLGCASSARKWMSIGLELANKVPGMSSYKTCMEDYLAGFEKKINNAER